MRHSEVRVPWNLFLVRALSASAYLAIAITLTLVWFLSISAVGIWKTLAGIGAKGLVIALALAWAGFRRARLALHHLGTRNIMSAQAFLETDERDFVLILRPFGGDGSAIVRSRRWLWSPRVVLEDLIEECVRGEMSCPSYSLVDPKAGVLTAGPKYLLSDGASWKTHVDALLKRSRLVLLMLPPLLRLTPSMFWELTRLSELGFRGRTILVLPRPTDIGYRHALSAVHAALAFLAPDGDDAPDAISPVLAYPRRDGQVLYWYPEHPKKCGGWIYRQGFKKIVEECLEVERQRRSVPEAKSGNVVFLEQRRRK